MKRILTITVLSALFIIASGQKSIDRLFDKYAGKDGFVSISLSGNLLNLIKCDDDSKDDHWPAKVTEMRILVQEDEDMSVDNFFDAVRNDLDPNDYEEFMTVKESGNDLKMLARIEGAVIKELLLIGGGEDNFIIQIKGNITKEEAKDFYGEAKRDKRRIMLSDLE